MKSVSELRRHEGKRSAETELAAAERRPLSPYPNGWYALAFADELRRGGTLSRTFAGHEIILFRTASGRACALDAYCPHLGAHLGYGGRVEGEVLRCPFHGFCYDGTGRCVATGYGTKPPPTAVSRAWPLVEVNGMLCAYYDVDGRPPTWDIPQLETPGWSAPSYRRFELAAHPQETTENSVDLGHFAWVHGYRSVSMRREVVTDGPYLNSAFRVRRPMPLIGRLWYFEIDFETHIYGLGYSMVDVKVPAFGIRARLWVLPTPIDGDRIALYLAASGSGGNDVHPALRVLPSRLRAALIGYGMALFFSQDAQQDFAIWENKRYVHPPALADGDGPIGKYRSWAAQFYPGVAARRRAAVGDD